MTQYLYTMVVLYLAVLCMLFLTATNEYILSAHRKAFIVGFLGESFITACEVVSLFFNGSDVKFKQLHFLSNYFGFLLTPLLIIFFAVSIGRFHHIKGAIIGMLAYFVSCNVLSATKQLFFIDVQNNYHRGNLFFLYLVSYFLAVLYLLYETLRYSRKGFIQHKIFAYILSVCFLFLSSFQVFNAEIYITRITVVFSLCIYYAYSLELTNLFDKHTSLLNHGTYLRKIQELKAYQTVIILDIDDFKLINDNYGHQYGDKCLSIVSRNIKIVFENYGQCYRIGGDEFAVVLRKSVDVESLIKRFDEAVDNSFKNDPVQLSVSTGYARCEKNDFFEKVIQKADFNMYSVKKQKKALREGLKIN